MSKYRCIQRYTLDNVKIHEIGDVIDLTDEQAQVALTLRAVIPTTEQSAPVTPTPSPEQIQQEVDTLQHQLDTMTHEGAPAVGEGQ